MARPSWFQWLVLYAVEEGEVWWDGGHWRSTQWKSTLDKQVNKLAELGLVDDTAEPIAVTVAGLGVLRQYSLAEVVDKVQGRGD